MSRRAEGVLLCAIVWVAVAIRLRGLGWGLPGLNEEAVPLRQALEMWGAGTGRIDLNPHYFYYPSLTFYLHFAAQAVTGLLGLIVGWWRDMSGFRAAIEQDPGRFVLVGRAVTTAVGVLAILPAWALGRRLGGVPVAAGAALILALTPLAVASSRYVVTDIPLMTAVTFALLALWNARERGGPGDDVRAGLAVGLAVGCKFTGAFLLVPLLAVYLLPGGRSGSESGRLGRTLLAAVAAFALSSPWILLDLPETIATQLYQQRHQTLGHFGGTGSAAALAYLERHLPHGFGIPLSIAAVLALLAGLRAGGWPRGLAATALLFGTILGMSRVDVDRYLLPLLPFVALLVPLAAARGLARTRVPGGAALFTLLLLLPVLPGVWRGGQKAVLHDATRREAEAWLRARADRGALVAAESYSVEAVADSFPLLVIPFDAVEPNVYAPAYSLPFYAPFDFVVLSSAQYDRYFVDPRRFPAQIAFYDGVARSFEPAAVFEGGPGRSGPTIRIFRRRPDDASRDFRAIPPAFFDSVAAPVPMAGFLLRLGATLGRGGREELALAATEQALSLTPDDPRVLMNLGAFRARRGEFLTALRLYERALAQAPGDAAILYNIGRLYQQKDDCGEALKYYLAAQRENPRLADSYLAMAYCQVKLDYMGPARLTLERFLERFPGHHDEERARTVLRELAATQ